MKTKGGITRSIKRLDNSQLLILSIFSWGFHEFYIGLYLVTGYNTKPRTPCLGNELKNAYSALAVRSLSVAKDEK